MQNHSALEQPVPQPDIFQTIDDNDLEKLESLLKENKRLRSNILGEMRYPDLPNQLNKYGETSLIRAARRNRTDVIPLLLRFGAKINQLVTLSWVPGVLTETTPLFIAASEGNLEGVRLLVEAGADLTCKCHLSPIDWRRFRAFGSEELASIVGIKKEELIKGFEWRFSPLGSAILHGHKDVTEFLMPKDVSTAMQGKYEVETHYFAFNYYEFSVAFIISCWEQAWARNLLLKNGDLNELFYTKKLYLSPKESPTENSLFHLIKKYGFPFLLEMLNEKKEISTVVRLKLLIDIESAKMPQSSKDTLKTAVAFFVYLSSQDCLSKSFEQLASSLPHASMVELVISSVTEGGLPDELIPKIAYLLLKYKNYAAKFYLALAEFIFARTGTQGTVADIPMIALLEKVEVERAPSSRERETAQLLRIKRYKRLMGESTRSLEQSVTLELAKLLKEYPILFTAVHLDIRLQEALFLLDMGIRRSSIPRREIFSYAYRLMENIKDKVTELLFLQKPIQMMDYCLARSFYSQNLEETQPEIRLFLLKTAHFLFWKTEKFQDSEKYMELLNILIKELTLIVCAKREKEALEQQMSEFVEINHDKLESPADSPDLPSKNEKLSQSDKPSVGRVGGGFFVSKRNPKPEQEERWVELEEFKPRVAILPPQTEDLYGLKLMQALRNFEQILSKGSESAPFTVEDEAEGNSPMLRLGS